MNSLENIVNSFKEGFQSTFDRSEKNKESDPITAISQSHLKNEESKLHTLDKPLAQATNLTVKVAAVQKAMGLLAQHLHAKLGSENKNVCFSPLSIYPVVCMVAEALDSQDRKAFLKSLGLDQIGFEGVRAALKIVTASFNSSEAKKHFTLNTANGMAVAGDVKPKFLRMMKEEYEAEIFECSQNPEQVCGQVNRWVDEKTNHKIPNLLTEDSIPDELTAILLNAIYFMATWQSPFEKDLTSLKPFYFADGSSMPVRSMRHYRSAHLLHFESKDKSYQMVEMPFKASYPTNLSCMIILPNDPKSNTLRNLEESFHLGFIKSLREQGSYRDIELQLPVTDMNIKTGDLIPYLLDGVKGIRPEVKLPGIGEKVCLSKIVHCAKLKVNEEGAEGAAATAAIFFKKCLDLSEDEPIKFTVDRPFAYAIVHEDTILFQGSVKEASAFIQ